MFSAVGTLLARLLFRKNNPPHRLSSEQKAELRELKKYRLYRDCLAESPLYEAAVRRRADISFRNETSHLVDHYFDDGNPSGPLLYADESGNASPLLLILAALAVVPSVVHLAEVVLLSVLTGVAVLGAALIYASLRENPARRKL